MIFLVFLPIFIFNSANSLQSPERLSDKIWPTHYELYLKTYLPGYSWSADDRNLTTEGTVKINITSAIRSDYIVLHSAGLEIKNITIEAHNPTLSVDRWGTIPGLQLLLIHFNEKIPIHLEFTVTISFSGKLKSEPSDGYFVTRSGRTSGEETLNAVTQFETVHARTMVPCFDEPAFKATWKVTLEYPVGATALTNTIEENTETSDDGQFQITSYKTTVPMSSYLLAVFIGDVEYLEVTTNKGLRIRVYTEPNKTDKVEYAIHTAQEAVEKYEELFDIKFPMEKLDFVPVRNYSGGAMENWGLIVHNNYTLLSNYKENQIVPIAVLHEVAHQWFGNLVTAKFWDEIWLNEGFATYMEKVGQKLLRPEIDEDWMRVSQNQRPAFNQTEKPLKNIDQVEDLDDTSYNKGSSFIRMLEKVIGTDNFFKGLRHYLSENAYQNVDEYSLYHALSKYFKGPSGKSLAEVAKCWTHQNGYPVIRVERKNNSNSLVISQRTPKKFITTFGECDYKWDVPIFYQSFGEETKLVWLERGQEQIELEADGPTIINVNSIGLFLVDYSDEVLNDIAKSDEIKIVSTSTKFRLLFDSAQFFHSTSLETKLNLCEKLYDTVKVDANRSIIDQILSATKKELDAQKISIEIMLDRIKNLTKPVLGDLFPAKVD